MRVIFAGTPEFARVALAHMHEAGFDIALVLTQPDRPAGRGMKLQASAVKQWALAHQIPTAQPRSLRTDGKYPEDAATAHTAIESARADVMVVAAYGLILPQWVLDLPRLGVQTLPQAHTGALHGVAQPIHGVCYAHKKDKREAALDWTQPATTLARRVRAFDPFPVASSVLGGETIKFGRALAQPPHSRAAQPGEVIAVSAEGVDIATASGVLRATRLQKAGGKALEAADFLHGFALHPGQIFAAANHTDTLK